MAIFTSGVVISEIRGSEGGSTFSRNRYGQYIRQRSVPVNPNSARQQAVRADFQSLAERWNSILTAAQRAAWDLYGASVPMLNKLGQQVYLPGFNHYLRSNISILQNGMPIQDDGPTTFSLPEADNTMAGAISEATQLISVSFDANLGWVSEDDAFMGISMSKPVIGSRNFIGGPYRLAGTIAGDNTTPPTSPQTIAVPFAVTEDQKVIVEARIGRADGRLSNPFRDTVTVAA